MTWAAVQPNLATPRHLATIRQRFGDVQPVDAINSFQVGQGADD